MILTEITILPNLLSDFNLMTYSLDCLEVMKFADRIAIIGNHGAITDAAVSAIMARAALRSAVYNVVVNLKLIKDESYNKEMYDKLEAMQKVAEDLEKTTLATTDEVLG